MNEQQAREALEALLNEDLTALELGLTAEERDTYHVHYWQQLCQALGCEDWRKQACEAFEALLIENFVADENKYSEYERDIYHAHHWGRLGEAVGARRFCSHCYTLYRGEHTCSPL